MNVLPSILNYDGLGEHNTSGCSSCAEGQKSVICSAEPCAVILSSTCVFYEGPNLIYTGINTNDTVQTAIEKIEAIFASGIGGTSGTSGTTGSAGTSGTSGVTGSSGSSGSSGTSGTTGTSGSSGTSGTNGSAGTTGSSGTSGTNGSAGTSGTSGIDGTSGINGTSGTNGSAGTSGTSGINGNNGTSGTSGINGTSGTNGIDGTSGTSGVNGTSGTSGINGTSGTSGVNGVNGTSGTSGINGTSGVSGSSGTSGVNGANGTSGTSGASGTSGTSGVNGTNGTSGTSGAGTISGIVNKVAKFTAMTTVGNSSITDDGSTVNFALPITGTSGTFSSTVTGLFVSPSSNPASTGVLRLANNNPISWRNQANSADISLYLNSSNVLVSEASFNTAGTVTAAGATLTGALSGTTLSMSGLMRNTGNELFFDVTNGSVIKLNTTGTVYGVIQQNGSNSWSLGYSSSAIGTTTLGTTVLSWNASNSVGIGQTANSSFGLAVTNALPSIFTSTSNATSSTYGGSVFERQTSTVGNGNGLAISMNGLEYAYFGAIIESNGVGTNNGSFIIAPQSGGVRTERLRLNSSGRLLVGTTTDDGSSIGQFNGNVLATTYKATTGFNLTSVGVNRGGIYGLASWLGTGTDYSPTFAAETGLGLYFYVDGGTTKGFNVATTGAATFSSTAKALRFIANSATDNTVDSIQSGGGSILGNLYRTEGITQNANITVSASYSIYISTDLSSYTYTLPNSSSLVGGLFYFRKQSVAGTITLSGNIVNKAGATVTSLVLSGTDGMIMVVYDGSFWYVVN